MKVIRAGQPAYTNIATPGQALKPKRRSAEPPEPPGPAPGVVKLTSKSVIPSGTDASFGFNGFGALITDRCAFSPAPVDEWYSPLGAAPTDGAFWEIRATVFSGPAPTPPPGGGYGVWMSGGQVLNFSIAGSQTAPADMLVEVREVSSGAPVASALITIEAGP